jgi:anthranilate/para-aminobenzoate synthase component II
MQTLTLQVQDNFVPNLLNILKEFTNEVTITKDKNLEYDQYFYDRQKQLQQDINDIDNDKVKMINNTDFWNDIDTFTESLQK